MFGKPFPFQADIKPRSTRAVEVIEREYNGTTSQVGSLAEKGERGELKDLQNLSKVLKALLA